MAMLLQLLLIAAVTHAAQAHAHLVEPPSRNIVQYRNGAETCPHCLQSGGPSRVKPRGNGIWPTMKDPSSHGLCGDPVQNRAEPATIADMAYMEPSIPQRTYVAGSIVEFRIGVSAHHMGHFEFRICDRVLDKSLHSAEEGQECLNTWLLQRAPRRESCGDDDFNGDCQPINPKHPDRWYLPPQNGGGQWDGTPIDPISKLAYAMRYVIPLGLACEHCTLQWYWVTGNTCAYDKDYFEFDPGFKFWVHWRAGSWATCENACCGDKGWGEEFWNCADVKVLGPSTSVQTSSTASSTRTTLTTERTTSTAPTSTTTSIPIQKSVHSGSKIFLKTHSGSGNMLDVEGTSVQARWLEKGAWQAMTIETSNGGEIHSGDAVFLTAHTGKQLEVEGESVQARWTDKGAWQSLRIEKASGSGAIFPGDVVCFKAHTAKHIDVNDGAVRARWGDCGTWQSMRIEVEDLDGEDVVHSGDNVYLQAHTGKHLEVDAEMVRARFNDRGTWQRLRIERPGGGDIYCGDVVSIVAHTAKALEVESEVVQARYHEFGTWQQFTVEAAEIGVVRVNTSIFLKAHTGKFVDVDGISVQARWSDRGLWQSLTIEKQTSQMRRLNGSAETNVSIDNAPARPMFV